MSEPVMSGPPLTSQMCQFQSEGQHKWDPVCEAVVVVRENAKCKLGEEKEDYAEESVRLRDERFCKRPPLDWCTSLI